MLQRTGSKMALIPLLLIVFSLNSCSGQVPLIMWTSEGYTMPQFPHPSAGHIVSRGQFVSYLNSALKATPQNVVLFLQDKLSIDDFTVYGGVFGNREDSVFSNLESALQASTSRLVLPALAWPVTAAMTELFQEELGVPAEHTDPDTLTEDQLHQADQSLLVISLPYSTGADSKERLRKNDAVIGHVLSVLTAKGVPYTAVYTGHRPSTVIQDTPTSWVERSPGRSLLQVTAASVKPPVTLNSTEGKPCIMLWAETLSVKYSQNDWFDLAPHTFNGTVTLDGSVCNGTVSRLVLNYPSVLGFQSFRLIFSMRKSLFPVSAREWSILEQVELDYDGQTATFLSGRGIYSPAEYSFHCQKVSSISDPLLVPRTASDNATLWSLSFTDFQIQGFGLTDENFKYASDCSGFFTPGIWMGLVTSLLMILVLTYGLHMIMQLRTMDRFDDPKGPSISVPQSE
ncbi:V-type proton ATPase subunit S1b [Chanos chanos]|uniref:V-type proton ATPase subunit S1b n=1 Tax=Chanos chanos TaxID=29144 RepID=A0A6J2UVW0_CHACN|nr:V-type proton ATPase subunit S1-like [Chanos chanos]